MYMIAKAVRFLIGRNRQKRKLSVTTCYLADPKMPGKGVLHEVLPGIKDMKLWTRCAQLRRQCTPVPR